MQLIPRNSAWLILVAFLAYANAFCQGTVNFSTRNVAAEVNAPLELPLPGGPGPGPSFAAALYLRNGDNLTLIPGSETRFQSGLENPLRARYVEPVVVTIPGVPAGSPATVRVRAWWLGAGETWEAAGACCGGRTYARVESGDLRIPALGGWAPADLPASFFGFIYPTAGQFIPEPRPIVLGLLGSALVCVSWFTRRKQRRLTALTQPFERRKYCERLNLCDWESCCHYRARSSARGCADAGPIRHADLPFPERRAHC